MNQTLDRNKVKFQILDVNSYQFQKSPYSIMHPNYIPRYLKSGISFFSLELHESIFSFFIFFLCQENVNCFQNWRKCFSFYHTPSGSHQFTLFLFHGFQYVTLTINTQYLKLYTDKNYKKLII